MLCHVLSFLKKAKRDLCMKQDDFHPLLSKKFREF